MIAGVIDTGDKFIVDTGDQFIVVVVTADKFIAGDKNKDAMEVGSCQG